MQAVPAQYESTIGRGGDPPLHAPDGLIDLRFRQLVGEEAWAQLPEAVRRRFSKRIQPGQAVLYSGRVAETKLSGAGRILAAIARVIGSPLPDCDGATGAAVVSVMENDAHSGQSWTRTYERPGKFPQVVHSMKRFQGPTGLEEYVGAGIGMALRVTVEDSALVFRSVHYFLALGAWRLRLPHVLEPGRMEIVHRDLGSDFAFELTLAHARFGRLVHQLAYFKEV
jgi:Domain of unknown function (DUF4166)